MSLKAVFAGSLLNSGLAMIPVTGLSSPNTHSNPTRPLSKLNYTTLHPTDGHDSPARSPSNRSPSPVHSALSPAIKPPLRSASSPQLHRVSKGDLRDLLFLTPSFPLKGIFDIGNGHFDVVLEEKQISWTPLSRSSHAKGEQYPKVIKARDIFAVQIQRIQRAGQESGGHPKGVSIFVVRPKKGVANGITWEEITLESTNEGCCQEWFQALMKILNAFTERPKRLKIFVDSLRSDKAKQVYDNKVRMLFHYARMKTDIVEVSHQHQVQDAIDAMDFNDVDGAVCIGGDTLTNQAVHGLLQRAQRDAGIEISPDTPMAKCRIPLGIIPTGLFNIVAHSTQGISSTVTATLHIILGHLQPVDVCSMYTEEGFLRFGFSVMYGFGSDCLRRAVKSQHVLKSKSAEYAMAKSLVKLRSYECEVSYIPLDKQNTKATEKDTTTCMKGCKVCGHAPDLTHLVHSTPLPLRPKDSPLALRKLSTHRPSLGAPLGANPNTNPRSSPNSSPMPTRRSMGASVPSLPMIAWSVESVQSSSEECLVTPKKKSSRDIVKSIFKRGYESSSSSAPNSRPSSAAWGDKDTPQTGVTGIQRGADTTQRNLRNAFTIGAGDQSLGIPTVHVTHDLGSKSDIACAQKGIGILPTTDSNHSPRSGVEWLKFQDSFISIGIVTLPNRSQLVPRGLAPGGHLADGRADLILVRKVNRKEFRKFLQHHGNEEDQFDFPFVWKHQVKAVQIRPLLSSDDLSSPRLEKQMKLLTWNVDMELVRADFIELRVHRQLLAVFGEGVLDDDFPTTSCRCL
ncbi:uncharacterized protein LOC105440821 isoform X2 [Strongylocentrotus purpuratus]|uniref:DAGKc domain-containing protein n=1 Tax=Strongylocentrotus purpuratus TaxID=7668 RepID=A0A7M7PB56_STRPU|nr:uncharacterized protein LOC105440821 isoform X2 [Strongylocentrotus purpuratus]